jgi:hypothetical protein
MATPDPAVDGYLDQVTGPRRDITVRHCASSASSTWTASRRG